MRRIIANIGLALVALILVGCDSPEEKFDTHYKRGLELIEQGELLKARLELRNALKFDGDNVPALSTLGELEQRLGNFQAAFGLYRRVATTDSKHLQSRIGLGNILLASGQIAEARKFAEEAYQLSPTDGRVLVLNGAVALQVGESDRAVEFAKSALESDPDNLGALMIRAAERLRARDVHAALAFLNRAEQKNARSPILQFLRLRTLSQLGDNAGVEKVLTKLIGFYPKNEALRYALARWYHAVDRKDDAERVLRQVTTEFPESTQAGSTLVTYLVREKGFDAAKAELLRLIDDTGESFQYRQTLARLMFSERRYDEAYKLLEGMISETGTTQQGLEARTLLARMKSERNETSDALALASAVLEADAKNAEALAVRGYVRLVQKSYSEARDDFLLALSQEPESVRIIQLLANAYELTGSTELAEEQYAKALRLDGFQPRVGLGYVQFLLRYGKTEQAERVLTQVRTVAPSNRQVLTVLGRIKLARQDWLGAQEVAEALRKLDDTSAIADRILADVLSGQQKFEESNELLKAALADTSSDAAPLARYVENLVRSGKSAKAVEFLREILTKDAANLRARILLASVYESTEKVELAETEFKKAAETDSEGIAGLDALARFHIRRSQIDAAETAIREALSRQDSNLSLRLLLASVLERTGRFTEAIAEYRTLFEVSPQSSIVANNLASLLADYGDGSEDLEQAYSIAVRFSDSDVPYFQDTLGWIHYLKKDYDRAVSILQPAAEQLQTVGVVQYHLGMTYKALGQNALAIEQLEKAIKLSENQQFAQLEEAQATLRQLKAESVSQE